MNHLVRRTIHLWQSWRARRKLTKDAQINQAKRSHGKTGRVRDLERQKRDMMTRALGGQL